MFTSRRRFLAILLSALTVVATAAAQARAELKLPSLFSDHMVVQRDAQVPIWGWADSGAEVEVSLAGASAKTKAAADGTWRVALDKLAAGGPHTLNVTS